MLRSRFQNFEDTSVRPLVAGRIAALRAELARTGLDGFVIPRADEHQGEYVPPCAARLGWATGFTGSAGTAVVLADKAALVIDGRYTLQAAAETDAAVVTPVRLEETSAEAWIEANLPRGGKLGFDPWLATPDQAKRLAAAAEKAGGTVVPVAGNPIDAVWSDRPAEPSAPVHPHPLAFAGESAADKLGRLREALEKAKLDALLVSDPHNLAWIFNIRGGDVGHTPIPRGFVLVPREGRPTLFLRPGKLSADAQAALAPLADVAAPETLPEALDRLGKAGAKTRFDASTAPSVLAARLKAAGGVADIGPDPATLMKARKNAAELAGARAAHLRDGAAMVRFLAWLAREAPNGRLTEIDAARRLEDERVATGCLRDLSFPSITAAGPNAALPHYRVSTRTNRRLEPGIYLIDSGGQYEDGTTDITRTVAVGAPTPEMRDRYTRVLAGHIAISRLVFPKGVTGAQLDSFARLPLWRAGLDFDHGTGHGIGSYLSVHEGPQRIAKLGVTPLEAGMILSNEPGYYREGAFGIRIENLIVVEKRDLPGAEREMFGFETIAFCPYDRALIEKSLLTADEIGWVDAYHAETLDKLGPLVAGDALAWLRAACAPL